MYVFVRGINFVTGSMIFQLDFNIVPTWYFCFVTYIC